MRGRLTTLSVDRQTVGVYIKNPERAAAYSGFFWGSSPSYALDYSSGAIASEGHTPAQVPQSMHCEGSIT